MFYRGWITVMRHWPASLLNRLQLGRSLVSVALRMLQMLSPVSTGFECPSASRSNWQSSYTELFTALHLSTYPANCGTSLICRRDTSTSSLLDVRPSRLVTIGDCSFPAAGPRLWNSLPVELTSSLLHHPQHFVRN